MSFFRKSNSESKPKASPIPPPPPPPLTEPTTSQQQKPIGFETVIGRGCTLEGVLRSDGNIRLDGTFAGTLEITGNVLVGELAKVEADINAKNISIAGIIRGNVSGNKVQLLRSARVWGDITAVALTTEEGAFIDGKISMPQNKPPEPEAAETDLLLEEDDIPVTIGGLVVQEDEDAEDDTIVDAILDEDDEDDEDDDGNKTGIKIVDEDGDDDED